MKRRAASGLSVALTRPPGHGGYRQGSGRKPILDGAIKRTFQMTHEHLDQIDKWGRAHGIDNRSAALRHLVEHSPAEVERLQGERDALSREVDIRTAVVLRLRAVADAAYAYVADDDLARSHELFKTLERTVRLIAPNLGVTLTKQREVQYPD